MNYLVTHPQLRKFMTEYLNDLLNQFSVSEIDSFIIIDYNYDEPDEYSIDDIAMEYDSDDGRLYLGKDFTLFFKNYFPNEDDVIPFIKDWFENEFGVKIKYIQS